MLREAGVTFAGVDDYGMYDIPKDSAIAMAPRRRNGELDMRYAASRQALAMYERNTQLRHEAYIRGEDIDKCLVFY